MIILGIDPGLATIGYGVIQSEGDRRKMIDYGVVTTPAKMPVPLRLRSIVTDMNSLLDRYKPDDVALEELFFTKNITTGINVAQARGAILATIAIRTDNLYEYTPNQIKQAVTGYGGADKHQMQQMVKLLLNMPEIAKPDDAADALAIALTHAASMRSKQIFRIM